MSAPSLPDLPELAECLAAPVPGLLLLRYASAVALDQLLSGLRSRIEPRPLHEVHYEPRSKELGYCPELVDRCRSLASPKVPAIFLRPVPGNVAEADVSAVVTFWKQLNSLREAMGDFSAQIILCLDVPQTPFAFSHARDLISWCSPKFEFLELTPTTGRDEPTTSRENMRNVSGGAAMLTWNSLSPLWQQIVVSGQAPSATETVQVLLPLLRSVVDLGMVTLGARIIREGSTAKFPNDSAMAEWLTLCGELAVAQGDLAGALSRFTESKVIGERLVASDPANAVWRRNLSVSLDRLGDVALAQGDLALAMRCFTESRNIRELLVARDPANTEWQRGLSVSLDRLGDIALARGDLASAMQYFTESKTIAERHVVSDPGNALWQSDLSISLNKLGNVSEAQGDLVGALRCFKQSSSIAERIAASNPANTKLQRGLSVSLNKLGDLAKSQGDFAEAWRCFKESKTIAERLAASDLANAEWQRDLSVSLDRLGDLAEAQGDLAGALRWFEESKTIAERLATREPANAVWKRDLGVSYWHLAGLCEKSHNKVEALVWWRKAYEILANLKRRGSLRPVDERFLATVQAKLADQQPGESGGVPTSSVG